MTRLTKHTKLLIVVSNLHLVPGIEQKGLVVALRQVADVEDRPFDPERRAGRDPPLRRCAPNLYEHSYRHVHYDIICLYFPIIFISYNFHNQNSETPSMIQNCSIAASATLL